MAEVEKLVGSESPLEVGQKINEIIEKGVGGGAGLVMFDTILKDHVLTYEESKGLALQGTYVYKEAVAGSRYGYADFYNKCLEEYNEATGTETINGVTVNVNSNGHKFYDIADKDAVDSFFNTMGTAWFYGIDTENERIFLPRNNYLTSYITDGSKKVDVYGTGKALGMTNGSAKVGTSVYNSWEMAYQVAAFNKDVGTRPNTSASNPSNSNYTVFGVVADSATSGLTGSVDLQNINNGLYVYICVGNTEVTSSITDVVDVTTTENDTTPLFTGMYFDFTPNNVSWLKAGEQKQSGNVYTFCYNELVNELTSPKYGLKVINVADMIAGVDYSEYWKVNQDAMTFTTPTKLSYSAINADEINVYGAGALGLQGYKNGEISGAVEYLWCSSSADTLGLMNSRSENIGIATKDSGESNVYTDLSDTVSETAQLYFKVANAVQNLELMDVAKIEATKANKTDVDGQWVAKTFSLVGSKLAIGNYTYDISSYLPNDGFDYEVMFELYVNSAQTTYFIVKTPTGFFVRGTTTAEGATVNLFSIFPIDTSRQVIVEVTNTDVKGYSTLYARGYRRIGTNL